VLLQQCIYSDYLGIHCRSGVLVLVDVAEIGLTGLFALVIAIIVTAGKNETCNSLEEFYEGRLVGYVGIYTVYTCIMHLPFYSKSCADIYIKFYGNKHSAQVYQTLFTAQVS